MRLRSVAVLSLLFTYAFFFEYLPPFRWVDIPHDLEYYHYPLDDFAFQALRQGHIPEWDPTLICGMTFVGNAQTAMFYPPMWLAFLSSAGHSRLKYRSLEILVIGHVWLWFFFCYIWLRRKGLQELACTLGAGVFAYSGYMLLQLSHLGLVCGIAWLPMALWSIDQAVASRSWRPLWKLMVGAALCLLAGHPPVAFVFMICVLTYAAFRPLHSRVLLWTGAALAFSFLLAMVQLLPTWDASAWKEVHESYGAGIRDPAFYISYLIPNFYDFGLNTPPFTNRGYEYLYLGAPAFFGLLCLVTHPKSLRGAIPILSIGVVSAILVTNPFDLVWTIIKHSELLSQVCRSWYFLAGICLSVAALSAFALEDFFRRQARPVNRWLAPFTVALLALWSARQIWHWLPSGPGFATGWRGALEPAVMLTAFCVAAFVIITETGARRAAVVVALLLAVGIDYKVFGTSKRINGFAGNVDRMFARASFPGLNEQVYRRVREHPEYRVALDRENPVPMDLRHYGLTTPQGGDALMPAQFHEVLPPEGEYYGDLIIDPRRKDLLQLLGVGYYLSSEGQPFYAALKASGDFRAMQPADSYFTVFEVLNPKPAYRWDVNGGQAGAQDSINKTYWSAERREFTVRSEQGGRFILVEQFFPGWQATIDGRPVLIERWNRAFQSIVVAAGEHRIRFTFASRGFRVGALISGVSALGLLLWCVVLRRSSSASSSR